MAIEETITIDAGPAIGELDALAGAAESAAAKIDAAFKGIKVPSLGGSGAANMARSMEAAAEKVSAAVDKIAESFARLGTVGAGATAGMADIGKVASDSAAGLARLAAAEKAAADAGARVSKSSTTAADGIKGLGDTTKTSSAWLDEYNATMAATAKTQADFARVSADANAKIAMGQRLNTAAYRDASAEAMAARKVQAREAAAAAASAEASSKKHSNAILGIAAAAAYGVYQAGKLQAGVTRLYTTAGESKANLPMITSAIPKLAGQTATSQSELLQGLYMIESAGFHGKSGLSVLKAAAQGAYAEGAPLGETGNALTSLMNAYGMKPGQATSAMNQIIAMVSQGKMTMAGAVSALPSVLPIAATSHLSFGQVGGALGTMTSMGMSPDQAAQNLAHTIGSLANPSHVQTLEMQQLGINSVKLSKNLGKEGLTGAISQVEGAILHNMGPAGTVLLKSFNASKLAAQSASTEIAAMPAPLQRAAKAYLDGSTSTKAWRAELQSLPAIQANVLKQFASTADAAHGFNNELKSGGGNVQTFQAALAKAMGGQVGRNVALMLGGANMGGFRARAGDITQAGAAGTDVEGWKDIQHTFNFQLKSFEQTANAALTTVGTALLPAATGAMKMLAGAGSFLAGHPELTKDLGIGASVLGGAYALQRVKQPVMTAIQGVGTIGKVLHIPGLEKLADVGKGSGLAGAATSLDGAGASLRGAAGALSGAAEKLAAGGGVPGGIPGGKGPAGSAAAEAESAAEGAGGVAAGGFLAKVGRFFKTGGGMDFEGLASKANPIIAGVTAGLMLRGYGDSKAPKGTPAGAMNDWLQKGSAPGNQAMNHYLGGLESWFTFSKAGLALGRSLTQRAPAPPPAIPAGAAPAVYSRFGSSAAPQAAPAVKPKIAAPDTSAVTAAAAHVKSVLDGALSAVTGKRAKIAPPDMSGLDSAKGKAQAAATAITSAITGALGKPVHAKSPDLSAYASAAGKARADGANISAGLASGILSGEGAVVAAASQVAAAAAAAMSHAIQSHSPSKVTEKTGKDFDAGFVVGLQGGQSAIDAAATAIGKSAAKAADIASIDSTVKKLLAQVPKGDTALTAMLKADNRDLDRMAQQRAKLEAEISDSEQVAKSMVSGASIMNSLSAVNPAGNEPIASSAVITGQGYQAESLKQFAAALKKDQALGLNATSLSQIAQAGPDQGLGIAQGIASGGKGAVKELNAIQKQIQSSSASIGNIAGPAMYQAGKDAGAGLAAGLKSELGSLDKAMEKLADSMVSAVEKNTKKTKAAAKKAGSGTASAAAAGASDGAASGSGSASSAAATKAGKDSLAAAGASLSHAGASLSAAAAALSSAATALQKSAGGSGSGSGSRSGPAGGGAKVHPTAPAGGRPAGGGYGGTGATGYLPSFGGGGQHVHYHQHVTVNNQGSVMSENDLVDVVQGGLLKKGIGNWKTGIIPPGRAG